MKTALTLLVLALCSGCFTRETVRYDKDGKPWSKDKIRIVLMRAEVSKLDETVTEKANGDYERKVKVGALKGETETDKLRGVVEGAVEAGIKAGAKAFIP